MPRSACIGKLQHNLEIDKTTRRLKKKLKIGGAAGRERVKIPVVAEPLKKKRRSNNNDNSITHPQSRCMSHAIS